MTKKNSPVKKLKKAKTSPKHVVVFQDEEGTVLKTAFVPRGEAAVPPELAVTKKRERHYDILFDGWDQDFTKVNANMVIKPVWKKVPRTYLVMYFHENGSILGMESVLYGNPATRPYRPEKTSDDEFDYPFIGWNCDLSSIKGDTNAKAVFGKVRRIFTVRFYHEDGSLLKEEKVHYDECAHAPEDVRKEADPVYHYRFAGWTYPLTHIRSSLNIHAIFEEIYNEYSITFFEENEIYTTLTLHYGDSIIYPDLWKKGYHLIWDRQLEKVKGDEEIHGSWHFSNPKGRIFRTPQGEYQIIDPSIHSGKACCLKYHSRGEKRIHMPKEVKLGDYYYQISEIGPYALAGCTGMETLILSPGVKIIRDRGLAGCHELKHVIFGKNVTSLGKGIFTEDAKLKKLEFEGKEPKKINRDALAGAPKRLEITGIKMTRLKSILK